MDDERLLRGLRFTVQRSSLRTHRVAQTPDLGLRLALEKPRTERAVRATRLLGCAHQGVSLNTTPW